MELPQERRLRADSDIGRHLLSQARRVEDAGVEEAEEEQAWQMDLSWMGSYSLKFQGCHYVQQVRHGDRGDDGSTEGGRLRPFAERNLLFSLQSSLTKMEKEAVRKPTMVLYKCNDWCDSVSVLPTVAVTTRAKDAATNTETMSSV
jgi:hypothetical protein